MPFTVLNDGSVRCDTLGETLQYLAARAQARTGGVRLNHEPGCIYAESGHPGECVMRGDKAAAALHADNCIAKTGHSGHCPVHADEV